MRQRLIIVAVVALALLIGAGIPAFQHTGFNGINLNGQGLGTATPVLVINSRGIPAEFKVNQTPVAQINSGLDMTGPANFDGAVDFDSTVDFSGATVTGVSTSTLSTLTVTGSAALNGGITADTSAFSVADTTGNTVISGTLSVTSTSDLKGNLADSGGVLTVADNMAITGQADAIQLTVTGYTTQTNNLLTLEANGGSDVLTVDNSGNVDAVGSINYGAADLYPLGYASDAQQIVCGTNTFTESAEITPTGLTTVTYVLATQVTTPASTGAFLTASDPATSTFVLSSWEDDYTEGTTPVVAHWCAVGDQ